MDENKFGWLFLISAFRGAIFFSTKSCEFKIDVQTPLASRGSCWAVTPGRRGEPATGEVRAVPGLELLPLHGSSRLGHAWVPGSYLLSLSPYRSQNESPQEP